MIDADRAAHLLHDLDPFHSLALPHAAIAGVYLFLSGLIAGYYDNLAVYNKIGERIRRHRTLQRLMPASWLSRLGGFIEANLGAIMGNFLFGVFLGSTATIGYLFGLPIDIRHIAFASANLAHGLFNLPADEISISPILLSFLGVLLIGAVNLMVSFSLALFVALRSKEVRFFEWGRLTRLIIGHLMSHPFDFIWPRPKPMTYARIDSHGHMIFEDNSSQKSNQPLPSKYVVRRLSDVKVLPKSMRAGERVKNPDTSIHNAASKAAENAEKVIDLDDGLANEVIDDMPATLAGDDIAYDKATKTLGTPDQKTEEAKAEEDKHPLPKPKKPPKLPH